jgi:hypothetical protein
MKEELIDEVKLRTCLPVQPAPASLEGECMHGNGFVRRREHTRREIRDEGT